jgi:hypothetical protein
MKRSVLPVGAGCVGPRAQVGELARRTVAPPRVRGGGRPVIRHHRPHRDPLGPEPRQRPIQEREGIAAPANGLPFGEGQTRVVVNGYMDVLPGGAVGIAP